MTDEDKARDMLAGYTQAALTPGQGELSAEDRQWLRDNVPKEARYEVDRLLSALAAKVAECERMREWLDNNTTFYDVNRRGAVEGMNVPALALVSQRIWYHATDDTTSYPFSAVLDAALAAKGKEE